MPEHEVLSLAPTVSYGITLLSRGPVSTSASSFLTPPTKQAPHTSPATSLAQG